MTGQEQERRRSDPTPDEGVTRCAEGRLDAELGHLLEALDGVDAAAADHTKDTAFHAPFR
jgi:hypothetical protein